jgi:ATP-dependent Clp protease ATP-binding subunit ClpA
MIELTKRAKKIVHELSKEEAKKTNTDTVSAEHVFLALLSEQDSVAIKIIINLSINISLRMAAATAASNMPNENATGIEVLHICCFNN